MLIVQKENSYGYFNMLTSDQLFGKLEALLPEHRERLYPPTEALSMFLSQAMSKGSIYRPILF